MFVRSIRHWLVASCAALVCASFASAQTPDQARKAIQALYDKESVAASKKDAAPILADMAPSFVTVSADGKQHGFAEMQKQLPLLFKASKSFKYKGVIQKFQLKGHTALVTVKEHTEFFVPNPQTQKDVHVIDDDLTEDNWTKGAKGWQRTHSKTLSHKETVDGKAAP